MMDQPQKVAVYKKRGCSRGMMILLMVGLVCIGSFAALVGSVFIFTQPITEAGSAFLNALRDEDYDAAYAKMTGALQNQIGSAERLRTLITEFNAEPSVWSISYRSSSDNTGELRGTITTDNGSNHDLTLLLLREEGEWRIAAFNLLESTGAGSN